MTDALTNDQRLAVVPMTLRAARAYVTDVRVRHYEDIMCRKARAAIR